MKSTRIFLAIVILMGFTALAFADGAPIWPWGTNPKTSALVNSFCDAQQAIMDNTLLGMLPPEFAGFISYLAPATGDLNGTSYVIVDPTAFSLNGNGMLDCSIELKLIEEVLRDTNFSVNGLTHVNVHAALNANSTRFNTDVGLYWSLAPGLLNGLQQVLLGHTLIGDGTAIFSEEILPPTVPPTYNRIDADGSWAFIQALGYALKTAGIFTNAFDGANYIRMPQYFSKAGDADSDGASNDCEYRIYGPDANAYAAAALNPAVHPTVEECAALPEFGFDTVYGGGWYEAAGPQITIGVIVKDATGTVTYGWEKNSSPLPGETNSSLTLSLPAQTTDSGRYRCTATDQSKKTINADIYVTVVAAGMLPVTSIAGILALLAALVAAGAFAVRKARARA